MATYTCMDSAGERLDKLTQYDTNRVIKVSGIEFDGTATLYFHFANKDMERAIVIEPEHEDDYYYTTIPNELLARPDVITIYFVAVSSGGDEVKTLHRISIPVEPRPKPIEYVFSDSEINIAEDILRLGEYITLVDNGEPFGDAIEA